MKNKDVWSLGEEERGRNGGRWEGEVAVILGESRCSAGVLGRVQDPCINTGRPPGNTTPRLPPGEDEGGRGRGGGRGGEREAGVGESSVRV